MGSSMMYILETGYQSTHAQGFYAAFMDAGDSEQYGLEHVLAKIKEIMSMTARARFFKWICASHIDPLDWSMKCRVAKFIQEKEAAFLPVPLRSYTPAQLASHIPELIRSLLSAERAVTQLLEGNYWSNTI